MSRSFDERKNALKRSQNLLALYGGGVDENAADNGQLDYAEDDYHSAGEDDDEATPSKRAREIDTIMPAADAIRQFAPVSKPTPSALYATRQNRGTPATDAYRGKLYETSTNVLVDKKHQFIPIEICAPYTTLCTTTTAPGSNYGIMMMKNSDVAAYFADRIDAYADRMDVVVKSENVENDDKSLPDRVYGRVLCERETETGGVQRLNPTSMCLEGSGIGSRMLLNIAQLNDYSLASGMIVCLEGTNLSGKEFCATKLVKARPIEQPIVKFETKLENIQILSAAGPYTTSDSLSFEPLLDLLHVAVKTKPHALILLGPILPVTHPLIDGDDEQLDDTYENVFEKLLTQIAEELQEIRTKVIVVCSSEDANGFHVYPTCPPHPSMATQKQIANKVTLVCDPCTLDIGGVLTAITSVDYLKHMSVAEIANLSPSGSQYSSDRLARLLSIQFDQSTSYALYPSSALPVDYTLMSVYGSIPCRPHLLLTASDLRAFTKIVDNVVCTNPGRLTREKMGGSYARIDIHLVKDDGNEDVANIVDYTNVVITNI